MARWLCFSLWAALLANRSYGDPSTMQQQLPAPSSSFIPPDGVATGVTAGAAGPAITADADYDCRPVRRSGDTFDESLTIRIVTSPDGTTNSAILHFEFAVETNAAAALESGRYHNYDLFPEPLAGLTRATGVTEFQLSLTRGAWHSEDFGQQPAAAPQGAELVAWLGSDDDELASAAWGSLASALSGTTSTSLDRMKWEDTFVGSSSMFPRSSGCGPTVKGGGGSVARVAVLPDEHLCTENLTPWLRRLPRADAGLAAALRSHAIFRAGVVSLRTSLAVVSGNGSDCCNDIGGGSGGGRNTRLRLLQSLTMTVAIDHKSASRAGQPWSLQRILGSVNPLRANPLARSSVVVVDLRAAPAGTGTAPLGTVVANTPHVHQHNLLNNHHSSYTEDQHSSRNCDSGQTAVFDVTVSFPDAVGGFHARNTVPNPHRLALAVSAAVVTEGRGRASIHATVTNSLKTSQDLEMLFPLPWYLRPLAHTHRVRNASLVQPQSNTARTLSLASRVDGAVVATQRFEPPRRRRGMGVWAFVMSLPPHTTVDLRFDVQRAFLRIDECPPEPNRPFALPAVIVSRRWVRNETIGGTESATRIYSKPLVILMPHPDFSMPFNVIALTSTALAASFGLWIQFATRPLVDPGQAGTQAPLAPPG